MTDHPRYLDPQVVPTIRLNLSRATYVLRKGSKARRITEDARTWLVSKGKRDDISVAALGGKIILAMTAVLSASGYNDRALAYLSAALADSGYLNPYLFDPAKYLPRADVVDVTHSTAPITLRNGDTVTWTTTETISE